MKRASSICQIVLVNLVMAHIVIACVNWRCSVVRSLPGEWREAVVPVCQSAMKLGVLKSDSDSTRFHARYLEESR